MPKKIKKITNNLNYKLVKNILLLNKTHKFYFINFSTDQVYNNKKLMNNVENNTSFDQNYYSKTKIKADKLTNKFKFLTLRINFFGKSFRGKGTFTDWLYVKMKLKEKSYLFEDQFISGLNLNTLSSIISKILLKREYGIFNLGSIGQISKKKLALIFLIN